MAGSVSIKFTAQTESFRNELKKAQTSMKEFGASGKDVQAVNSQITRFSGQKLITESEKMALALRGMGGAAKLTDSELKSVSTRFDEYSSKMSKLGLTIDSQTQKVISDVKRLRSELDKPADSKGGLLSSLSSSIGIGAVAGGTAGVVGAAVSAVASQLGDIVNNASRLSALQLPFERMSGGAASAAMKLQDLRTATLGLVGDADLMTASNRGTALGLDRMGISFTELARVSTILAQNMGQDVGKSLNDLSEGLSKGSAEVLNNVGVIVKADDAYGEYAKRIGKAKDELSAVEQQSAIAVIGFEQAKKKAEEFGAVPLTMAQNWSTIGTAMSDIIASAGGLVVAYTPFSELVFAMAEAAGYMRRSLDGATVPEGFGPGATASNNYTSATGAAQPTLTASQRNRSNGLDGDDVPSSVARGLEAIAVQREADAKRYNAGMSAAEASILRETQKRVENEKKVAEAQKKAGYKPKKEMTAAEEKAAERERKAAENEAKRERKAREKAIADQDRRNGERITQDVLRSAETTRMTTLDMNLWGGSGASLLGRTGSTSFGSNWISGGGARNSVLAPANTWGKAAESYAPSAATLKRITDDVVRTAVSTTMTTLSRNMWGQGGLVPTERDRARTAGTSFLTDGMVSTGTGSGTNGILAPIGSWGVAAQRMQEAEVKSAKVTYSAVERLGDLSAAIATLSQISGGALDPLTRALGNLSGGFGVGASLGKVLGLNDKQSQALGGGIGVALTGFSLGQSFGRVGGTLAGAGAGAGTGAMIGGSFAPGVGHAAGAIIGGIVGGTAGYFGARTAEKELRQQRNLQAGQMEAEYGGLDKLLDTVGRLGLNQESWLKKWYGEPKEFAKAVGDLNKELTRERLEATKLAEAFERVHKTQGLLKATEIKDIVGSRRGGQGDASIATFLGEQTSSLISGLDLYVGSGKVKGAGVGAAGAGLGAAFSLMREQGLSTAEILRTLEPTITSFRANVANAGSAESFAWMDDLLSTMNNADLTPFIDQATGASQILTALLNTGMLTQDSFSGLAQSIVESADAMTAAGKGSQALDLLQPQLQQLWEASEKFGFSLTESQQALIDTALAGNKIGEAFLPATDRMANAIDRLVERLGAFIDQMGALSGITFPTVPDAPSAGSGGGGARQEIYVNLDGRQIAEATARYMPDVVEVYG